MNTYEIRHVGRHREPLAGWYVHADHSPTDWFDSPTFQDRGSGPEPSGCDAMFGPFATQREAAEWAAESASEVAR